MTDTSMPPTARVVAAVFDSILAVDASRAVAGARRARTTAFIAAGFAVSPQVSFDAVGAALLADAWVLTTSTMTQANGGGETVEVFDPAGAVAAADIVRSADRSLAGVAQGIADRFERWDGHGGPRGLVGNGIADSARIVAAASAITDLGFDADRVRDLAGLWFDPEVAAAVGQLPSGSFGMEPRAHVGSDDADPFAILALVSPSQTARSERNPTAPPPPPPTGPAGKGDSFGIPLVSDADTSTSVASLLTTLTAAQDPQQMVTLVLRAVLSDLDMRGASLWRHQPGGSLELVRRVRRNGTEWAISSLDQNNGNGANANGTRPLDTEPGTTTPSAEGSWPAEAELGAGGSGPAEDPRASRPIVIGDQVWGRLQVDEVDRSRLGPLPDPERFDLVAAQASQSIAAAQHLEHLAEQARLDPLTGVGNRRVLEERLDELMLDASPEPDVAMIMADLNGLKRINDTRGHDAGDDMIRLVARALLKATRAHPLATVCRIGGDEFCVVLTQVDADQARAMASEARKESQRCDPAASLSCGIAFVGPGISTPRDLLRAADRAQYQAKRDGLGTVVYQNGRPPPEISESGRRSFRDRS